MGAIGIMGDLFLHRPEHRRPAF